MDAAAITALKFDEKGLIPAILQDWRDGTVLMVAYMNREALEKTLETGIAHFWSRSRKELWEKGATSGHRQRVREVFVDCDQDTLLITVTPDGPACHTGERACFFKFGYNLNHRERSLALARCVKRRDAHQSVYTRLVFQRSIGILAKYLKCDTPISAVVILVLVQSFVLRAFPIKKFHIHLEKYACEVLRVIPARTGEYGQDSIAFVVLAYA